MAGKWLGMLTQIMPPVLRVAVLFNPERAPQAGLMLRAIEDATLSFAVDVRPAPVQDDSEIEATMAGLERDERGDAVFSRNPLGISSSTSRRQRSLASKYRQG
jgi:putative ABC transport system substrate-binding protein